MLAVAIFLLFFFFSRYGDHRDLHSFPTRRSSDLSEVSFECLRSFRVLGICQSVAVRMIVNPACSSADRHPRCVMNVLTLGANIQNLRPYIRAARESAAG